MLYLLDTNQDYDQCARELGVPPAQVGQLLTPLTQYSNRGRERFAIDNGAFARFDAAAFLSLLERERPNRDRCLFVVVPDVPGAAMRTLEAFHYWYPRLHGWPLALACQDGQESLPIPWELIRAVFIGGSTSWKLSQHAEAIVKCAKLHGVWAHVGRVNDPRRLELAEAWGVDSVDGSGLSRYTHMRERIAGRNGSAQTTLAEIATR